MSSTLVVGDLWTGLLALGAAIVLTASYVLADLLALLWRQYFSPLQRLRGPPSPSFLFGNLREMYNQENTGLLYDWDATYGSTYAYKGFFGGPRLQTMDLTAVAHILSHSDAYQKPNFVRDNLAAMGAGSESVLTTEGEVHRRQVRFFFPLQRNVKRLTPVFRDKASELRDVWIGLSSKDQSKPIDVLMWLSRATLDVIGIAGFGYRFNALSGQSDELANAYHLIFATAKKLQLRTILETWIPLLRKFRVHSEVMDKAHHHLICIGLQLINERKTTINHVSARRCWDDERDYSELSPPEPDLLSVLVRSNMASFASQRLTTPEVLCQISTFLIAGYETSSSALTWCLYALAICGRQFAPSLWILRHWMKILSKLEYLDWVVRETLRFHAPVTWTMRVAMEDDEIPVQQPFWDKHGELNRTIKIAKHDIITIPIQAINKSYSIWGQDAHIFRPERWKNPPESSKAIQGLYSNILTFLSGNRGCIGYRFALAEIKMFLFTLIRDLEFTVEPAVIIEKTFNVVARPVEKSRYNSVNKMPLFIRPIPSISASSSRTNDPNET
ncbi:cytochrome P450 [Boletus edulis BED1]|uniref:Cytochrome P450 n=1 Tax=Boletus edulis BED1 TaxID=1328754 RepID=A0AAD4BV51_BOLED|nr:cytochrome P450 [Boletus edulis BED1]